ncbi:ABC transporter ATP-binding protein/permease [candidate division KSB1 bacterium]|nr:ABC transporter ATP-binding protein/permease [candidate division KSB1 bacterium]
MIANIFQLFMPRILKFAIDQMESGLNRITMPDSSFFLKYGGLIVLTSIGFGLFRFTTRYIVIATSRRIEYDLRNDFFRHLQTLRRAFFQQYRTGDLMTRATSDLNAIRNLLGPGILMPMSVVVLLSVGIGFMVAISLRLTLYLLLTIPFAVFIIYRTIDVIEKTYQEIQAQFSTMTTKVQENIAGIRVIKGYVQEAHEIREFSTLNVDYVAKNIKLAKIRAFLWSSMGFLFGIGTIILLWFGGQDIMASKISIGDFVAFSVYIGMLAWPIFSIGWVLNMFKQGVASASRLNEILKQPPETQITSLTRLQLQSIRGAIEFQRVTFSYRPDLPPTLVNINLKIAPGEMIALVGPTGAGKTTLVQLLLRIFDSQQGQILIDGQPITAFPLDVLRSQIGYVAQDTFLFSETIKENIAFGKAQARAAEIRNAALLAQIESEILEFPDGFDTMLGERGINLSGGQKQRLTIARALIGAAPILLLDDALSSVDTHTEEKILHHLREVVKSRTGIIVSHRLSAIKEADRIYFLDRGQIVEQGQHAELLRLNGHYARLYQQQLLKESLAEIE